MRVAPEHRDAVEAPPVDDTLRGAGVGARLVRGGIQRSAAFVATNLLTAVGSVFLLRRLGVAGFGRYGTVMAITAIVLGVTDAGLTVTGSRELALRDGPQRHRLLSNIVGARLVFTAAGVALAVAFTVLAGYGHDVVAGTAIAGTGAVLISTQAALLLPLSVDLLNGRLALNELIRQFVLVAGFVALGVAGAGILPFFAMQVVAGVAVLVAAPALVGRHRLVRPAFEWGEWRTLAVIALPLAVSAVMATIYLRLLVVLTSLIASAYQTGLLATSARIYELIAALPLLVAGIAVPVLTVAARENEERFGYVLQRMTEVAVVGGIGIALTLSLAAGQIVVLLGGHQFRAAVPVLRIQSVAILTIFVISAWVNALIAMHRQRVVALATLAGLAALTIAGVPLTALFAAKGAAAAADVADVALAITVLVVLRRAGPGRLIDWRFAPRACLALGVALTAGLLSPLPGIGQAAVAAAVLAVAALALRLVPPEVTEALRARAPGER
jgi:O-antigen/teichoic acid export membrane protein